MTTMNIERNSDFVTYSDRCEKLGKVPSIKPKDFSSTPCCNNNSLLPHSERRTVARL